MRDLLGHVGVERCTSDENAPHPTQCGTGRAACGCGAAPPCHFTLTKLTAAAGKLELSLPGPDRAANAALIAEVLQLEAAIPKKGNLGQNSDGEKVTRNWPVVGYHIRCGGEALENPVPILNLLCNGVVAWGFKDLQRLERGLAVARADPRYAGQSDLDIHSWEAFCKTGEYYEGDDGGAQRGPVDECRLTAASQQRWTQKRAMFNAMPAGMPAEEQIQRVSLALSYPAATVDALTTWDAYGEKTVASMLAEVADAVGHEELGHQLHHGIILRAAQGARLVGVGNASKSSAVIPMMMEAAKRFGVPQVEKVLMGRGRLSRDRVESTAPAAPAAAAPAAPAAAPAVPLDAASSSPAAPAAPVGLNTWTCQACGYAGNSDSDEVCVNEVPGGQSCNSTRASAEAPSSSKKRTRTATDRLNVTGGSSKTYGSASGASSSRSGGPEAARAVASRGGKGGSSRSGRGKARANANVSAAAPEPGGVGTIAGRPPPTPPPPTPPPDGEGDEDALIRKMVEALVQSSDDVEKEAGFVRYDHLILSDDVRKWAGRHYIFPLREFLRGEGGKPSSGLLLTGPPGTGKTALAKAIAVSAGAALLPIGNSNVLSQWAGKADRTVAAIFAVARQRAPCIVFFDEVEKLLQSTASGSAESNSNVTNG